MGAPSSDLDRHIWALGFPEWVDVSGRLSVADLFRRDGRHGVYVVGFGNGERYVGQSVDVVKRFAQHRLTHHDITSLTFRVVPAGDLSKFERECIYALEAHGVPLRNLDHMSVVRGERDLDDLIPPEEQTAWLNRSTGAANGSREVEDADLRRRLRPRFDQFVQLPLADDALLVLGTYTNLVVPFPHRTELTFWCMSCLPSASPLLYSRVNINMQEVLTVRAHAGTLWVSFHLAKSPFERLLGNRWQSRLAGRGLIVDQHGYKPGGQDQLKVTATNAQAARELMAWQPANEAMSLLNLNLMRKGPTYWSRSHCLDLVDAAMNAFEASGHQLALSSEEPAPRNRRPRQRRSVASYRYRL